MAVQLNKSFEEILSNHGDIYEKIVVGVFYGKKDDLTDKYDILRGINRGANHDVTDLTEHVDVCSGAEFWKWINNGEEKTQDWVMEGVLRGIKEDNSREECGELLHEFNKKIIKTYDSNIDKNKNIDWHGILKGING